MKTDYVSKELTDITEMIDVAFRMQNEGCGHAYIQYMGRIRDLTIHLFPVTGPKEAKVFVYNRKQSEAEKMAVLAAYYETINEMYENTIYNDGNHD